MRRKALLFILIFTIFSPIMYAAEETGREVTIIDYQWMMFKNSLIPGLAQFDLGQYTEGLFYMTSVPLSIAGIGLLVYYIWQDLDSFSINVNREKGETYLVSPRLGEEYKNIRWMFYTGLTLSLYSSLLAAYSSYAAHRDYTDLYGDTRINKKGRERFGEILLSPYKMEYILSWDFFPVFPITIVSAMAGSDITAVGNFFRKNTVGFWGFEVPPLAGFALNTLFTFALVTANSAAEEIMYRGLNLEREGIVLSSLSFGIAHLGNVIVPGVSVESTVLQSISATFFGFYAGYIVKKNNDNIGKAVALHFWHNIFAFTLNYLISEGNDRDEVFYINIWCRF